MNGLQVVDAESRALLAAARQGLDVPVPSCPGWRLRDLVGHLGQVQRFHAGHLVRGVTTKPAGPAPDVPQDDDELLDWYEAGLGVLLDALRSTDPQAPAWTWAPHVPPTAAFWTRRMALEAAVHRWDAEAAHGAPTPIAAGVAADGVDEVLAVHRPADWADEPVTVQGLVAVRLTDTGVEHVVRVGPDGITAAGGEPDAVLAGPASELLLALWGRRPLSAFTTGDGALVEVLRTG